MLFEKTRKTIEVSQKDFLNIIEKSNVYEFLNTVDFNTIKGYDRFQQRSEIYKIILNMLKDYFQDKSSGYVYYGENYSANGIGNNSRKPIYLTEDDTRYLLGYVNVTAGIFPEINIFFQDIDLETILPLIERHGYQGVR